MDWFEGEIYSRVSSLGTTRGSCTSTTSRIGAALSPRGISVKGVSYARGLALICGGIANLGRISHDFWGSGDECARPRNRTLVRECFKRNSSVDFSANALTFTRLVFALSLPRCTCRLTSRGGFARSRPTHCSTFPPAVVCARSHPPRCVGKARTRAATSLQCWKRDPRNSCWPRCPPAWAQQTRLPNVSHFGKCETSRTHSDPGTFASSGREQIVHASHMPFLHQDCWYRMWWLAIAHGRRRKQKLKVLISLARVSRFCPQMTKFAQGSSVCTKTLLSFPGPQRQFVSAMTLSPAVGGYEKFLRFQTCSSGGSRSRTCQEEHWR